MVGLSIDPPPSSRRRLPRGGTLRRVLLLAAALAAGFWLGRATAPGGALDLRRLDATLAP